MMGKNALKILAATCLFVFSFMAACQSQADTPIVTSGRSTQEAPAATRASAQPTNPTPTPLLGADQIQTSIVNALLALQTKPNRMEVTTELGDGQTSQNVIEFIPPDRKRILSPADNLEYIVIGDKVYANTSGEWKETRIPASTFLGDGAVTAQSIADTIREAQFVRRDQLDGTDLLILSYTRTTFSSGIELTSQAELWLGTEDGLPHKMVMDGETLSASTDPASGESKLQAVKALTTTFIYFDPSIKIASPVIPAPVSKTLEEWIQTTSPDKGLIEAVQAPYLKAMGLAEDSVFLETRMVEGASSPFAVVVDKKTATPLLISDVDTQGEWVWQEATPGNLGALRWDMQIGINCGNALYPGVREKAAKFAMQYVSYDMTWALMEPVQGQVTFHTDNGYAYPDREVQYAFDHGQALMAGQLISTGQYPDWLTQGIANGAFTPEQVREFVQSRITTMMQRYNDRIPAWVVMNEYHPNEWGWMEDPLQTILGDYNELAFQTARQVNPDAILLYNDCGNETPDLGSYQYDIELAKTLHEKGLMDAAGIQMHLLLFKEHIPTYLELLNTFNAYKQVGVPVYITEMDVNMQHITGSDTELLSVGIDPASLPASVDPYRKRMLIQAQIYRDAIRAAIDSQNVVSITFFTIGDEFSWLNQMSGPDSDGTLFGDQLEPKPAYYAVLQELLGQQPVR